MIIDNRITEYLHSLEISRGELLDTIEKRRLKTEFLLSAVRQPPCLEA